MAAIPKFGDYFLSDHGGGLLDAAQPSGYALGLFSQMHLDGGWTPGTLDAPAGRSQEADRATEELLSATAQTVEAASFDVSAAANGTFHTNIDLTGLSATDGFIIQGDAANDRAGHSVSGAGDVNGDGFSDLIVGAYGGNDGGINAGEAYVIFGKASGFGTVDLTGLAPTDGFIIQGDAASDNAGFSVSDAGDVNGDGFADLIVGASGGNDGGINAGEAYVIFGKASGFGTVDLSGFASADGFVIQGDATGDNAGWSVSGAGDVNGDGFADLIVGASGGNDGGIDAGEAYVIFGKGSGFGAVDLSGFASADGFIIQGDTTGDNAGFSVSGAGDVNSDGFADLIVGASGGNDGGIDAGEAYVIFGKASGFGTVDLSGLASADGFIIQGDTTGDNAGWSVSGAGDVNGDGFADLIVGAPYGDDGGPNAGQAYVIFGKLSGFGTVDLTGLAPADGFIIQGDAAGDNAGFSVAGAGDVNGDGLADLTVGARYGDDGGDRAGEAYVIFGKTSGFGTVDLGTLALADGFIIQGDTSRDNAGISVSGAGDVNGDGFADLIVGASGGDDGGSSSGEAYVIFGGNITGAVTHLGTEANDNLTGTADDDIMIGGLGDDVLTGSGGNDRISGNGGNDTLVGGEDDDYLDGGGGVDTAVIADLSGAAFTTRISNGNVYVGSSDGQDILKNVETLQFTDGVSATTLVSLFDGLEYIASYGDLRVAFGADAAAGETHFIGSGFMAGRTISFDGLEYIASYGDLINAFGANRDAGSTHFINAGSVVGRSSSFDGLEYIASYGDLINALGADRDAGSTHFIDAGSVVGRSSSFDGLEYIASYGDLINAFGTDRDAGSTHFIDAGSVVGRTSSFNGLDYLASYTDLMAAFGADGDAGSTHFINAGFAAGRSATSRGAADPLTNAVQGTSGADTLDGTAQADLMAGRGGVDILNGSAGDDVMHGGTGADVFVFAASQDANTILDFNDGVDLVDIQSYGHTSTAEFSITDNGGNALVDLGGGTTVELENVAVGQLSDADFMF